MPKFELPTFDLSTFDLAELPPEVARPLYAGVGATDIVVGYVRDAVADVQKRFADLDLEPKSLRDALSRDAQARRESIEKRVAGLQAEAAGLPATVNAVYADLAKRGEVLVGRIRTQEATRATATAARTTTAKAKTTKTQATKSAKSTKSSTRKTTSTAKKSSAAPKRSAKATGTAAKKTASSAARATTDATAKVGD
ncbi:hypothetical protein [Nocardioides sp. YIM 152315]|uniref:hypothetical protein n=1 Tax=Nocardioides sp. YIM 152315 TaxID=3031760 RepID=UPI0023DA1F3E|nr:hypothetical protein [Nocardioides sp. YIM 152315]MDF1604987.1 hypothetical protein [Nocardioides sp. YIM 152315]